MEITVNNQAHTLTGECTIAKLLSETLRLSQSGIAVAVNQLVVLKSEWPGYLLRHGDQVVLIRATQGG